MFNGLSQKYKAYVQKKMEGYVVSYFAAHPEIKLVVIAGSVGKTSTKTAIATVLQQRYRVRLHQGNHNTHMSAPLAILGIPYPDNIKSISQWRAVFKAAEARIASPPDVDIIIQEIGADHPGEIQHFGNYLRPDIAVITAITPEHMEYFKTMDAVALEELSAGNFSQSVLINRDDIDGQYATFLTNPNVSTYGTSNAAEYHFISESFTPSTGHQGKFYAKEYPHDSIAATINVLGEHNLRPAVAAAAVGVRYGLLPTDIATGLSRVASIAGRMNLLEGRRGSMLIDDSYNSSPVATASAVQTLYSLQSDHKIAILGSMSELGDSSQAEHEKIGRLFDPSGVEWVITVGEEAERFLAPAARSKGCQVKSFASAVQAGAFAHGQLQEGTLVLIKGSQDRVFTEEATKVLLRHSDQNRLLVRQSPAWMARKEEYFASLME